MINRGAINSASIDGQEVRGRLIAVNMTATNGFVATILMSYKYNLTAIQGFVASILKNVILSFGMIASFEKFPFLSKNIQKNLASSLSLTGLIQKILSLNKTLSVNLILTPTLNRAFNALLSATATTTATLATGSTTLLTLNSIGSLGASISGLYNKLLSATQNVIASISFSRVIELLATLSNDTTLTVGIQKLLATSLTLSAVLTKFFSYALTVIVNLSSILTKFFTLTLSASQGSSATIGQGSAVTQELSASASLTAVMTRIQGILMTASNALIAMIRMMVGKVFAQQVFLGPVIINGVNKMFVGSYALTASITRDIASYLTNFYTNVNIVSSIRLQVGKIVEALLGNLASLSILLSRTLAAAQASTASMMRSIVITLSNTIMGTATLALDYAFIRTLSQQVTISASLFKEIYRILVKSLVLRAFLIRGATKLKVMFASILSTATLDKTKAKILSQSLFVDAFLKKSYALSYLAVQRMTLSIIKGFPLYFDVLQPLEPYLYITFDVFADAVVMLTSIITLLVRHTLLAIQVTTSFLIRSIGKISTAFANPRALIEKYIVKLMAVTKTLIPTLVAASIRAISMVAVGVTGASITFYKTFLSVMTGTLGFVKSIIKSVQKTLFVEQRLHGMVFPAFQKNIGLLKILNVQAFIFKMAIKSLDAMSNLLSTLAKEKISYIAMNIVVMATTIIIKSVTKTLVAALNLLAFLFKTFFVSMNGYIGLVAYISFKIKYLISKKFWFTAFGRKWWFKG